MRGAWSVLVFCVISAQSAWAGAWMRDPDTGFFSTTMTLSQVNGVWQPEHSLYGEYGLTPRLTMGVAINETNGVSGQVLIFARLPFGADDRRTKLAVELGLGGHHQQGQWNALVKTTFSVGRGFDSRWGNGWISLDAALELRRPDPTPAFKLDATLGLSSGRRFQPLLQFESTFSQGKPPEFSVIPGVLIVGKNNTKWQIGLVAKSSGQIGIGLKLGLWRNF